MTEWLWGVRSVAEALRGGNRTVHEVWIVSGPPSERLARVAQRARESDVEVRDVDADSFAGLGLPDAQRIAARCSAYRYRSEGDAPRPDPSSPPCFVVVLDQIEDPQNLGAIVRTADASGCTGIFIPERRAAGVSPAVVRASAGATEHVAIYRVGNIARTVERLQEEGYWTVALDPEAGSRWDEIDYSGCVALVLGAEGKGVRRLVRERCDFGIALPMHGGVGSLNVSAAFAAAAYEVVRQQTGQQTGARR